MSQYLVNVELRGQDNLSDDLKNVDNSLDDMKESGGGALESLFDVKDAIMASAAAGILFKGLEIAGELNAQGAAANAAERTYNQLSGGVDQATRNLALMRAETMGTVTDTELQINANHLLMMNLATTGEEAAKLTGMSVALGKAMGTDATTAAADFASMLANQSIPRLDTFGISSAAVRQEIARLTAAGMSMEDAFRSAVLSEGAKAMDRLGTSIVDSATATEKFNTNITNLKDNIGQGINVVVEFVAGEANTLLFGDAAQQAQQAQIEQFAYANSVAYAETFFNSTDELFAQASTAETFFTPEYSQKILDDLFKNMKANPTKELSQVVQDTLLPLTGTMSDEHMQLLASQLYNTGKLQQQTEATAKAQEENAKALAESARQTALLQSYQGLPDDRQASLASQRESLALAQQNRDATIEYGNAVAQVGQNLLDIAGVSDPMAAIYTSKLTAADADALLPDFMQPEYAAEIANQYQQAEEELIRLQGLADQKLITDDQLKQAENMTSNLGLMANEAQRAADNFKNMSLSQALGTDKADQMGSQMSDMILKQAQESGMSEKQLADMESKFAMSDGTETKTSQAMADSVAPAIVEIAKTLGSEAAEIAKTNVEAYLREAKVMGLTDEQTAAGLQGATGYTTLPADKSKGIAGQLPGMQGYQAVDGFNASQYAQGMLDPKTVDSVSQMTDDTKTMGDNMTVVKDNFTEASTQATALNTTITDMTSKTHTVSINVEIKNLGQLNSLMAAAGAGSAGGGSTTGTRANGGRPPGADPRAD